MQYLLTFLGGIASFISPCMLPILPLYISYFTGGTKKKSKTAFSALFFVLGFSLVFCLLGLFAGTLGGALHRFHGIVDIVCGVIIILLGLNFLGILHVHIPHGGHSERRGSGIFSAFLFGIAFSITHAPCLSAFLGTALMSASAAGIARRGMLMMLSYSLGLGIPFFLSALLIEKLTGVFDAIKRNYRVINLICGGLLIALGILLATGIFHEWTHI